MKMNQKENAMIEIKPVRSLSYGHWLELWLEYVDGQLDPKSDLHKITYQRLCEENLLRGAAAFLDGQAAGIIHYYFHPSTWAKGEGCHIQDLFVVPSARRQRVAQALIGFVADEAKHHGSHVVHWNTRSENEGANHLYAKIAQRSDRILYFLPLAENGMG